MTQDAGLLRSSEADEVDTFIRFTGAGAAPVVKNRGKGVATTRTGVGIVNLVWDESPGVFLGIKSWAFDATAQAGVKGYTVVAGDYTAATRTLTINITNAAEALTDLAAAQRLALTVVFSRTNVNVP
jgi:hypothetical protein